jgi:hypothetical protein
MRALWNQMGQRAVIHFFVVKGLKAKDIQSELESLYDTHSTDGEEVAETLSARENGFI